MHYHDYDYRSYDHFYSGGNDDNNKPGYHNYHDTSEYDYVISCHDFDLDAGNHNDKRGDDILDVYCTVHYQLHCPYH